MTASANDDVERTLRRRLDRERKARREAEAIAERVTAELFASNGELERVNDELTHANAELESVNQALRDFVAVASHELRGPLTSVSGFASMLSGRWEALDADKRTECLAIIERQSLHMARIVEELLTLSRIEAGVLDIRAAVIRVRDALDDIVEELGDSGEVGLETEDVDVLVDPHHLRRMVVNYIGNALKYGAPPVQVEARAAGEWVNIVVCDRGPGVPDDFVSRLFGKFAAGEQSRAKGGTGLGLSIVRGLARANGGDVWYEPNDPRGSRFGVRLPRPATTLTGGVGPAGP